MHPLGWRWAAFVWGYAIIWALASDRVKLFAYRILDPTTSPSSGLDAGAQPTAPNSANGHVAANVAGTIDSSAFHTGTDPRDPVFHDNTDCPYGIEIKNHHNDHPGTDHRPRCDWCAQHDQPVAAKR
jgi:H+-transporting ATPase